MFEYGLLVILVALFVITVFRIKGSYKGYKTISNHYAMMFIQGMKAKNTELNRIYLNSINLIPKNILKELNKS